MSTPNQPLDAFFPASIGNFVLTEEVPTRIQRMREAKGWSRPDLAKRCVPKTTGQTIERLEKRQRGISLEWLERIAPAFGVSPAKLVGSDSLDLRLSKSVSVEASEFLLKLALRGETPDEHFVQDFALVTEALFEMFARHPEARSDPAAARPVFDLLARQYGL